MFFNMNIPSLNNQRYTCMKLIRYILGAAILTGFLAGCSKDSFDPASKSRQDFEGTWTGSISTFKNSKLLS